MIDIDSLVEGSSLPTSKFTPNVKQIFMFSAITWNRHHVHYSKDEAVAEGLPDVVVQRGLIGNFMSRYLIDWAGDQSSLKSLSWLMRSSALPDQVIICSGEIEKIIKNEGVKQVHCKLRVETELQRLIAEGHSIIEG